MSTTNGPTVTILRCACCGMIHGAATVCFQMGVPGSDIVADLLAALLPDGVPAQEDRNGT